jgi:hypothetical protein
MILYCPLRAMGNESLLFARNPTFSVVMTVALDLQSCVRVRQDNTYDTTETRRQSFRTRNHFLSIRSLVSKMDRERETDRHVFKRLGFKLWLNIDSYPGRGFW